MRVYGGLGRCAVEACGRVGGSLAEEKWISEYSLSECFALESSSSREALAHDGSQV